MRNIDLVRQLIAKHGVDRYPTVERNAMKIAVELGELLEHIAIGYWAKEEVQNELADVVISCYALSDKLGFSLDDAIKHKVETDERKFA